MSSLARAGAIVSGAVAVYIVVSISVAPTYIYHKYKAVNTQSRGRVEELDIDTREESDDLQKHRDYTNSHKLSNATAAESCDEDIPSNSITTNPASISKDYDDENIRIEEDYGHTLNTYDTLSSTATSSDDMSYGITIDHTLDMYCYHENSSHHDSGYSNQDGYGFDYVHDDEWDHGTFGDGIFDSCIHDVYVLQDIALCPDDTFIEDELAVENMFHGSHEQQSYSMKDAFSSNRLDSEESTPRTPPSGIQVSTLLKTKTDWKSTGLKRSGSKPFFE